MGLLAIIAVVSCASHVAADTQSVQSGAWNDPDTWSGGVLPGLGDEVTISAGHTVHFPPSQDYTVELDKNLIVYGTLQMRPQQTGNPYYQHVLRFVNVDEREFVGGGMDPVPTDVGLWVRGDGVLDIEGTPKRGWARAIDDVVAGARSVELDQVPTGWRPGDTIVFVPTEHPSVGNRSWNGFEERTVEQVGGSTVYFSPALSHDHPAVTDLFSDKIYTAEVLNLSRNVRIEGTGNGSASFEPSDNGRAHINIRSAAPQSVRYAELVLLGPRGPHDRDPTDGVTGRYPLHFHMNHDDSRGSLVEGVVVRKSGNRAFVPHASHGITFRDTIAYDIWEGPYFWDQPPQGSKDPNPHVTHDVLYDRTVAAIVKDDPAFRGVRLSAFTLTEGNNPVIRDAVAVGVQGNKDASGFIWPENGHGVWGFDTGNVSHNNKVNGIFTWQNDSFEHVIENFVAYHNGDFGIQHGAYNNAYQYVNVSLFGNADGGLELHALPSGTSHRSDGYSLAFEEFAADGPLLAVKHNQPSGSPVLFKDCAFTHVVINEQKNPGLYDFVNCADFDDGNSLEPSDFDLVNALSGMRIRVQRADSSAYQIDHTGKVTTIAAFYDVGNEGDNGDTEPPSAPSGLTATAVSSTQVDLSWTASTDNVGVTGYRVYRDGSLIATITGTSHSDTGLTADTTYTYEVAAIDAAGNESDRSPPANATTLADASGDTGGDSGGDTGGDSGGGGAPLFAWDGPQEFDGVDDFLDVSPLDVSGQELTITARFTADDFDGDARIVSKALSTAEADHWWMLSELSGQLRFRLKTNGSTDTLIGGSLSPGVTHHAAAVYDGAEMRLYLDGVEVGSRAKTGQIDVDPSVPVWIGANPNGSNWFDGVIDHVHVYDWALSDAEIAGLSATTPPADSGDTGDDTEPPSAPSGLTATAVSSTQVDLSWTASTDNVGVTGYRVYRDGLLVATVTGTSHSDGGLSASTTYTYEVAAIDAADNESARSSSVSATTLADDTDAGDDGSTDGGSTDGGSTDGGDLLTAWDGPQDFNGTSDFVDLGAIDVAGTEITVAARFTADTFACSDCPSRDGRLVSKATGAQTADHYWMLSTIGVGSSTRLRLRLQTNGSTSTLIAASGNLQPSVSYHAAAVYDGAQMRLYLDGALVGSGAKSGSVSTNGGVNAWIGANPDGSRFWDGTISGVKIYDRALSASEIAALHVGG